jgi:BetI-type transcriptional repressor, C-terminal
MYEEFRVPLATLVKQGIERGEFRSVEPDDVALAWIALLEGLTLLWATTRATLRGANGRMLPSICCSMGCAFDQTAHEVRAPSCMHASSAPWAT